MKFLDIKGVKQFKDYNDATYLSINDYRNDEEVVAAALNDLNKRINLNASAINEKQNLLTFDSTPIENSSNPITSGGVYTALSSISAIINITWSALYGKIINDELIPGIQYSITDNNDFVVIADSVDHICPFGRQPGVDAIISFYYDNLALYPRFYYYSNGGVVHANANLTQCAGEADFIKIESPVGLIVPSNKNLYGVFIGPGNQSVTFDFTNAPTGATLVVDPYVYTTNYSNKTVSITQDYTIIRRQDVNIITDAGNPAS